MKTFLSGALAGALLSAVIIFSFFKEESFTPEEVTVTQVSGEKITHSKFDYKKGTIKFSTVADGKGEIVTEIPKVNIPEARYWMQNNHALMGELLLTDRRIYGVSYMRRWNNFSAGGGVLLSEQKFEGIKVQAQYWFDL